MGLEKLTPFIGFSILIDRFFFFRICICQLFTKEFISKTTLSVIPALVPALSGISLESFLKKDAGQASMTEYLYACDFTYGLISSSSVVTKEFISKDTF